MNNRGVSLVELIIVIGVIFVLAVSLSFDYTNWVRTYKVERATKDLYTDLMQARTRALQQGHVYCVDFPTAKSYRMMWDTNDDGVCDAVVPTFPKSVDYSILPSNAGSLTFSRKGMIGWATNISTGATDYLLWFTSEKYLTALLTKEDAVGKSDYNCIAISTMRMNLGKWTSTTTGWTTCNLK